MAPTTEDIPKLQRQLDEALAVVRAVQTTLNEAQSQMTNQAEPRSPRRQSVPLTIEEDQSSTRSPQRPKRRRESIDTTTSRKTGHSTVVDGIRLRVNSVYTDDSSDSDEGESFFAAEPLPREDFDEIGLRKHLDGHNFDEYSELILQEVLHSHRYEEKEGSLFDKDMSDDEGDHDAKHHDADVYEVDKDGAPRRKIREDSKNAGDHSHLWEVLRHTNTDDNQTQKAVGRIVVMREPTPLLCAALHYTMNPHFDMDSIFRIMIDDELHTRAYVDGHLSPDPRQQRSIVFMVKYHTLVGQGREPLPWQNHDDDIKETKDHVPISTCSAVVALSLAGQPARQIKKLSRKSRKRQQTSTIYDPFNPWHVLSVQCFPDWHSETDLHETKHHYVNGPDAFLVTLLNEYRDATKRFKALSKKVVTLATPRKRVVFDATLRDDLLFEEGNYMWSRRYFWAAQVLQVLADEIQDMITAYKDTFTEAFWSGEHKTLFFGNADVSARYNNFRKKIAHTRKEFQKEIELLEQVLKRCKDDQLYIIRLREWLFSGTSVLESRSARQQNYYISLLTLVSVTFLPLMFVTSVFGMTNMPSKDNFVRFGWVTVVVCVPTYLIIALVSNLEVLAPLRRAILARYHRWQGKDPLPKHGSGLYKTKDRKKLQPIQSSAVNSSLQRRLSQLPGTSEPDVPGLASKRASTSHEMRELGQNGSVGNVPLRRSMVTFNEPFHRPSRNSTSAMAGPSPNTSDAEGSGRTRRSHLAETVPQGSTERRESAPGRLSMLRRLSSGTARERPVISPA